MTLADLHGKPPIVHFWASWCGPCITEASELAALPAMLHGRASVVGVDWSDSHSHAVAFVRKHGWRFPILEDHDGKVGNRYRLAGLPTTFLLDSDGRIVKQLTGPQTARGLISASASSSRRSCPEPLLEPQVETPVGGGGDADRPVAAACVEPAGLDEHLGRVEAHAPVARRARMALELGQKQAPRRRARARAR